MAVRLAQAFVIAALILLLIYGADASGTNTTEEKTGFIPLDTMTRGIVFGGGAVVLSTAAFFVSLNERSMLVSILLIIRWYSYGYRRSNGGTSGKPTYGSSCICRSNRRTGPCIVGISIGNNKVSKKEERDSKISIIVTNLDVKTFSTIIIWPTVTSVSKL